MRKGFLFLLIVLSIHSTAQVEKLRSLDCAMNLNKDWNLYNSGFRLNIGHSWYQDKSWGIKKTIQFVLGKTNIYSDLPGYKLEEHNFGIQTLFSVYHRSENLGIEIGAGIGPGYYYNVKYTNGSQSRSYFHPSGEFQWYVNTGRLMKKWGIQLHSGVLIASEQMEGYNIGFSVFYYH